MLLETRPLVPGTRPERLGFSHRKQVWGLFLKLFGLATVRGKLEEIKKILRH